jgi:hypothetical protein
LTDFDGLWTIEFVIGKPDGWASNPLGYGVAVIIGSKLLGGNSDFHWTGSLEERDGGLRLNLHMATHSGAHVTSVADEFGHWATIATDLKSKVLVGNPPGDPSKFEVRGTVSDGGLGLPLLLRFTKK